MLSKTDSNVGSSAPVSESRTFTVNPAIIRHLISSQAGSLEKAFTECVMNSIDAGASKVEITLRRDGFDVVDDGCGFRTREEVLSCFEVFGFEHTDKDRVFGQFGLGRAQLWNWASTVWRTHQFVLDVDIRARGLDYLLSNSDANVSGMTIEGAFYERLSEVEYHECIRGLEKLCKYAVLPVVVNGRDIRHDPNAAKWDHEDSNCWIRKDSGWALNVYNQGIYVRNYSSNELGISGDVVTKRGKVLAVNMSRSDVLRQTCTLWPQIKAAAASIAVHDAKSGTNRLTDEKRDFLARQPLDDENVKGFLSTSIVKLSTGRNISIASVLSKLAAPRTVLTVADPGDIMAERANREGIAVVLAPRTLARFDAESPREFVENLIERLSSDSLSPSIWRVRTASESLQRLLRESRVYPSLVESPVKSRLQTNVVPRAKWKSDHRALLAAFAPIAELVAQAVAVERNGVACRVVSRDLVVGESNGALAFTDGSSYVAIDTRMLDSVVTSGLTGWLRLLTVVTHEYVHDTNDAGSHIHDEQFYETFHNAVGSRDFGDIYAKVVTSFARYCRSRDNLTQRLATEVDAIAAAA